MNKNTVIFDMDGVIIDSEPYWRQAQINELAKYNVTITVADCITLTMGKRLDEIAKIWCLRHQLTILPSVLQHNIMQMVVELISEQGCAKPGLYSLLDYLQDHNINIGLATSSSRAVIDAVLRRLKIHSYFSVIRSADDEVYGKPHPAVYLTTAKQFKVKAEQCIVIEDSVTGMIAGKAAAMTTWVVPDNLNNPKFSIAEGVFSSLTQVQHAFDSLFINNHHQDSNTLAWHKSLGGDAYLTRSNLTL
ncbi:MAG TPA: hexitol phosphatase HxpB [Psychromonas sp.]